MSRRRKALIAFLLWAGITAAFVYIVGSEGKNESFKPVDEFKLDPWIKLDLGFADMSINKAVLYLFLASGLTILTMTWVARRMQERPNNVQTGMEVAYDLAFNTITRNNMDDRMTRRWFPFVATLFFFIWFSNMLGYVPLPVNTHEKVDVFGLELPALALYSATANLSIPLVLTLVVWLSYQVEGVRAKGVIGYLRSWIPSGTPTRMRPFIFGIEIISQLVRVISLSVRLFANILAGHMLLLFMGGGLAVLQGLAALGVVTLPAALLFYLFEVGLVATLQAFIFATLTSIYLGEATAAHGH
ncbi:MAG TPA: F0F1 ATP synthase subunit A [Thermoleophilaceae bacterium]